jgi:hypothetical protein
LPQNRESTSLSRLDSIGLVVLYRNAEASINHGNACLLPNSHATWLALRGVPMNGQSIAVATKVDAVLRYGMPAIDCTNST